MQYTVSFNTQFTTMLKALYTHCSDITWTSWHLKSLASGLFIQQLIWANNKENIKGPHYWPFVRAIHWWPNWISRHKGQIMWKTFSCRYVIMSQPLRKWTWNFLAYQLPSLQCIVCNKPGNYISLCLVYHTILGPVAMLDISTKLILKLKSRKISFAYNLFLSWWIVLKFCTEQGSATVVLCAKVQNDWATENESYVWMRVHNIWYHEEFRQDILYCHSPWPHGLLLKAWWQAMPIWVQITCLGRSEK